MSNGTGEALLEVIEKSGLISPSTLSKAIGELESLAGGDARGDGLRVLEHLVSADLLTKWQAGKLRQGRHKGFLLGNYKLLSHLGTGGMSSVYLAEHIHMKQLRALKVLPRDRVADKSYLARFYREARAAAALDHPNIVHAYDIASDGDTHYLVVEYIDGLDLQKLVTRKGPLSFASAVDVMLQVSAGLAHAHKVGVVHRDIKPANLFVDGEGTAKILDMGLARFTSEEMEHQASLTQMHDEHVLGTTNYLAPEQAIDSHSVDGRADIYSLGCTFYFLLTASPPFPTGSVAQRLMMHMRQKPEPMSTRRPGVPRELEEIFNKMTAKKPAQRYQSALEVEEVFRQWADAAHQGLTDSGLVIRAKPQDDSAQRRARRSAMTFEAGPESSSSKDTDGGRGEGTRTRETPASDDDELRLVEDDAPIRGGSVRGPARESSRGSESRPAVAPSAGPQPAARPSAGSRPAAAPVQPAPEAAARNDDFLAELMRGAESATPSPPPAARGPAAGRGQATVRGPAASGKTQTLAALPPAKQPDAGHTEGLSVKKDLDHLFRRHPVFASIVFGMFAVMLVLGLYYMIRSSTDAALPQDNPEFSHAD